jgi:hypothetical protein
MKSGMLMKDCSFCRYRNLGGLVEVDRIAPVSSHMFRMP